MPGSQLAAKRLWFEGGGKCCSRRSRARGTACDVRGLRLMFLRFGSPGRARRRGNGGASRPRAPAGPHGTPKAAAAATHGVKCQDDEQLRNRRSFTVEAAACRGRCPETFRFTMATVEQPCTPHGHGIFRTELSRSWQLWLRWQVRDCRRPWFAGLLHAVSHGLESLVVTTTARSPWQATKAAAADGLGIAAALLGNPERPPLRTRSKRV